MSYVCINLRLYIMSSFLLWFQLYFSQKLIGHLMSFISLNEKQTVLPIFISICRLCALFKDSLFGCHGKGYYVFYKKIYIKERFSLNCLLTEAGMKVTHFHFEIKGKDSTDLSMSTAYKAYCILSVEFTKINLQFTNNTKIFILSTMTLQQTLIENSII